MIIPREGKDRERKVAWILAQCQESLQERCALYDLRRRYFLFGCLDQSRTLYNRLQAHVDLVSSFLYSADRSRFAVSAPRNSPGIVIQQMRAAGDAWNDEFRDSGLAYMFADALLWSLVFDSMFLKLGWNDARDGLFAKMVEPSNFGVFNEAEPDLDSQEAFVHSYTLDWDNAVMRLVRAGMRDKIPKLHTTFGEGAGILPPMLNNMIVQANAGAGTSGRLIGQVNPNYFQRATYESRSSNPTVQFHELWAWDDIAEDYCTITVCEPDIVISDSRDTIAAMSKASKKRVRYGSATNIYMPGEHPFVHISPFKIYNYFWGEAHVDRLMNLQDWSSKTLDNIQEILEQQVDPAKVFSGFMGLTDEKAGALGGPGSWVVDQLPGAKVDRLIPEMPPDLFANFQSIGHIFLEASGLTETVTGKGEQGVRGRGHAKQLATTGSGRIKKVAVGLEEPLVKVGDLGLKLMQRNDDNPLMIGDDKEDGTEFFLSQIEAKWKMRVAGHSHSPLFSDETKEMALLLMKAQAIDQEMFVRMMGPPEEAAIIHKLRETLQQKKMAALMSPQPPPGAKGGKKANGAAAAA